MFKFMEMMGNYEQRKVDNFTKGELVIDTAAVNDSTKPYETAVQHPSYNSGKWVVVEEYDTKKEAQAGHDRWVKTMTAKKLPESLKDVGTNGIARMVKLFGEDLNETHRKVA